MTENSSLLQLITEGIQERKGRNITCIDLSEIENAGVARFVICEGSSTMQVASIADSVREYVQLKSSVKPFNYDGYQNSQWIVIDYGDTLVHIFAPEVRQRYNLEGLWSDARVEEIPNLD